MSTTDTGIAFEAWAKDEGLIQESHGIMSINSMCDVARKAFDAGIAHAEAAKATGTAGEQKPRAWIIEDKEGGEPCFTEYSTEHVGGEPLYKDTSAKCAPNLSLLQRYAFDSSENGPYVLLEDVISLLEIESQPDVNDLRNMLRSLQNYEMSGSRAAELIEAWQAGEYSDDMLPEREPDKLEQIEKLKAEAARQPAPVVAALSDLLEVYRSTVNSSYCQVEEDEELTARCDVILAATNRSQPEKFTARAGEDIRHGQRCVLNHEGKLIEARAAIAKKGGAA